jgi:hypothetical protein
MHYKTIYVNDQFIKSKKFEGKCEYVFVKVVSNNLFTIHIDGGKWREKKTKQTGLNVKENEEILVLMHKCKSLTKVKSNRKVTTNRKYFSLNSI